MNPLQIIGRSPGNSLQTKREINEGDYRPVGNNFLEILAISKRGFLHFSIFFLLSIFMTWTDPLAFFE